MKPSRGLVPGGPRELSSVTSVIHGVSRSVRDSAALLDASRAAEPGQTTIAPFPRRSYLEAMASAPRAIRIGLIRVPLTQSPVNPECIRATVNAAYEKEAISISAVTLLYNATVQPAMSVPLHWTPQGLPVGEMFAGRYGEAALLFQLAGQLEQASPWFDKLPPL